MILIFKIFITAFIIILFGWILVEALHDFDIVPDSAIYEIISTIAAVALCIFLVCLAITSMVVIIICIWAI